MFGFAGCCSCTFALVVLLVLQWRNLHVTVQGGCAGTTGVTCNILRSQVFDVSVSTQL